MNRNCRLTAVHPADSSRIWAEPNRSRTLNAIAHRHTEALNPKPKLVAIIASSESIHQTSSRNQYLLWLASFCKSIVATLNLDLYCIARHLWAQSRKHVLHYNIPKAIIVATRTYHILNLSPMKQPSAYHPHCKRVSRSPRNDVARLPGSSVMTMRKDTTVDS